MVQITLKLDAIPEPDDVADAMAAGLCHLRLAPLARAMALARERARC
jgi:Holliday junction resolvasome RuvABC endonuclease subunit